VKLVAIGCSWGGLAALSRIFDALPRGLDAAVVVAQHRGPEESRLRTMLDGRSSLPVHEAEDKDELRAGSVYLAPPGYHVLVEPGRLALSTEAPVNHARPSLDVLFETAADAYGPSCVGVILTGARDDGAEGLQRICESGGAAIVQQPQTAERAEMPEAALLAVPSARILPLDEIPDAIAALCGAA
jgi:two-component system, chemotaxis family, protein-glutamate methylesterase/glutaminase